MNLYTYVQQLKTCIHISLYTQYIYFALSQFVCRSKLMTPRRHTAKAQPGLTAWIYAATFFHSKYFFSFIKTYIQITYIYMHIRLCVCSLCVGFFCCHFTYICAAYIVFAIFFLLLCYFFCLLVMWYWQLCIAKKSFWLKQLKCDYFSTIHTNRCGAGVFYALLSLVIRFDCWQLNTHTHTHARMYVCIWLHISLAFLM